MKGLARRKKVLRPLRRAGLPEMAGTAAIQARRSSNGLEGAEMGFSRLFYCEASQLANNKMRPLDKSTPICSG